MASAILTKYLGPTNCKGARIKAWSVSGRSVTIGYTHELSGEHVYRAALQAWLKKHGSIGSTLIKYVAGETKDGYAFAPCFHDEAGKLGPDQQATDAAKKEA